MRFRNAILLLILALAALGCIEAPLGYERASVGIADTLRVAP